ncbi:MAG TPA: guanylate kinase, partial [Bryobacteraceae bacterium]|nr:guanylate kinase [Bryobacteraceae bacterium]
MSIVFVISAPSGSGKSTLVRRLLEQDPNLLFSVSYTTRQPRGQEQPGRDYIYVSRAEFEAAIARDEFLEYAEVFGNYYGTHRSWLERARAEGKDLVLDIDVQGASQLKSKVPDAVGIFILAPSRSDLEARLRARSEDSEEVIRRRLQGAAREIQDYSRYDYVLINQDLDTSADTLASIVKAERVRRFRMDGEVRRILEAIDVAPQGRV